MHYLPADIERNTTKTTNF